MKLEKKHENNKFVADAANNNFRHVGTLKYINLLLHKDIHLQRVKYIIHEHNCLSSFLFFRFFFKLCVRERERVYKIGYKEKRSQSLLIFFFSTGFLRRMFPLLRANRLYAIFNTGLKNWLLRVRDIFFVFFYPEYLAFGSVRHEPCPTTNFFFSFFRWREEGATSVFRVPANHLASTFFLPVSGDPMEVTEYKHLFLTVILWRLATVNSNTRIVVIIFLASQWDTTWH